MRERDLPGPRARPAADDGGRGRGVVRRAEGCDGDQRPPRWQQPGDRVDPRHLERLAAGQRGRMPGKTPREHGLPGAGRAREEEVVPAGGGDLERAARPLLPADVGEVRGPRRGRARPRTVVRSPAPRSRRGSRRRPPPRSRTGTGRTPARATPAADSTAHTTQLEPARDAPLGDGERARDRPDAPVERELPDGRVLGEALRRKLPRRREHGQRDREVEPRSLLPERSGREVHRDPAVQRPLEGGGDDPAPHAVLRLLAGAVREPDDREAGMPGCRWASTSTLRGSRPTSACVSARASTPATVGAGGQDGDRPGAEFATYSLRRVAEDVDREVARFSRVVPARPRRSR